MSHPPDEQPCQNDEEILLPSVDNTPPGEVLESGFRFRPVGPEGSLSGDARRRVMEKMDGVEAARRRAARDALTAHIG